MFTGEYTHTIDAKGRLALPADFRKNLAGEIVLTKGFEGSIRLFSVIEYENFIQKLMENEAFDARLRRLRRYFIAGSQRVELDGSGRIRIPANLREFASLDKSVVVNGDGSRIEIWDTDKWTEYISDTSIEDLAGELAAEGLL